jgi:hypothetical protein
VFYTQQGGANEGPHDRENTIARFWHYAVGKRSGVAWTAVMPVLDTERPLWVYANVCYPLDRPVTAAGYYYGSFTANTFNISSVLRVATPDELRATGVKATDQPSRLIESFTGPWQQEWFTYDLTGHWPRRTHKLFDPKWQAPAGAKLAIEVRCEQPNKLVVGLDEAAAEVSLAGGSQWQAITLTPADFRTAQDQPLTDWKGIRELRLYDSDALKAAKDNNLRKRVGGPWQGTAPEFRDLRWVD